MTEIHYQIVQHDGGWAYKVGDVFSETFRSHDDALAAAKDASSRQELAGETQGIVYQDRSGEWHEEIAKGDDRPHADVVDRS
ncbi:DUF2188 domain-containing protein [Aureimonas pseudogalii]|jgi:hypothetical protein|uniref:DUF2188 domain-containing protein n=1 Tax=Aureimonas pseudogalii TaxID=1744844 RepID=A0A7W6EGP8_9HYPH|nr:DUF2188 domain-containing protein [Aureimonas pseudogalii]MBB3998460.1 hypothetical protein [Aureimonas pseudogalii]